MNRKFFGLVWMALIAACVGCSMCQAPYDYCAATIGPDGKPTGGFMTRQGSVLGGLPGVPVYQSQPTLAAPAGSARAAATGSRAGHCQWRAGRPGRHAVRQCSMTSRPVDGRGTLSVAAPWTADRCGRRSRPPGLAATLQNRFSRNLGLERAWKSAGILTFTCFSLPDTIPPRLGSLWPSRSKRISADICGRLAGHGRPAQPMKQGVLKS